MLASVLASPGATRAQDVPACALVDPDAVKAWALARQASSNCPVGCTGCGCKGGPGYRAPARDDGKKGHCASYARLVAECGPPPHERCTRECAPVAVGCRRPTSGEVEAAKKTLDQPAKRAPAPVAPPTQ